MVAFLPLGALAAGAARIAAEEAELGVALAAAEAEAEAACAALIIGVGAKLAMTGRDHEPVFVVGDGHVAVHFLHLCRRETDAIENARIDPSVDVFPAHIGPHGEHALER